ncbi:hypothetical protein SGM_6265 [Streptomyces griseoaurantiacus M045]|uniref:Uncharacterized protein n=1 Tax=Streptomyces griseoaurantiacus M045 TaxID=996637 RepID=F3NTG5_9ACTN|nr:hypothetical protein SGM_6265 [Streptomyces griseoaurantiacus M045]
MSGQRVPGAEHLPGAHGVQEGQHRLLDAALPGHGHPVAAPAHGGLAAVVDRLGEVDHLPLAVLPRDLEDLLGGTAQPVHHTEGGETLARELQHDVVQQPALGARPHGDVVDRAGHQEPQGVHDVDEVVEDHRAGFLGQPDAVLLHQDQVPGMVGALDVAGRVPPVETDRQAGAALLGQRHQPLGVGQFVGEGLVDVGGHARLEKPRDELGVGGGGGVHEGRVQPLVQQRPQLGVALPGGKVQRVRDAGERGGRAGVQVQLDAGERAEHREVGLPRDVAESDAADLHRLSPPVFDAGSGEAYGAHPCGAFPVRPLPRAGSEPPELPGCIEPPPQRSWSR